AVIGSGPAGLTCAHDLALLGYRVTVFEEAPVAGGMLVLGIPEFVLPRHIVEAEIDLIRRTGVEIRTGMALGESMSMDDLWRDGFKAVLLATGAWRSLELNVRGADLNGVLPALQFLRDYNRGKDLNTGEKVAVIGGGNVGIDAARAALRLGAREVNLVCLECREEMPAFEWEIRIAEEEGVRVHPSLGVKAIPGKEGKVSGLDLVECTAIESDGSGRIIPILNETRTSSLDADTVIVAIGQSVEASRIEGIRNVEMSSGRTVSVDPDTMATGAPGIFAAGDAVAGAGTVVEAIAAGKRAAASIDRYFRGEAAFDFPQPDEVIEVPDDRLPRFVKRSNRVEMPVLPVRERLGAGRNEVVEQGYSEKPARSEATRCLSCPVCGNCMYDRFQICYETATRLL
ncbi:MAG: FAD-dependent oxidoreductase, partial [Dehalococcoidia bacterium]